MAIAVGVAPMVVVGVAAVVGVAVFVRVGVAVAAPVGVAVTLKVAVLVGAEVGVDVALRVAVAVGVGVPFCTVTVIESDPSNVLEALNAFAEIVWLPLATVVEFQLKVEGGVEAK